MGWVDGGIWVVCDVEGVWISLGEAEVVVLGGEGGVWSVDLVCFLERGGGVNSGYGT